MNAWSGSVSGAVTDQRGGANRRRVRVAEWRAAGAECVGFVGTDHAHGDAETGERRGRCSWTMQDRSRRDERCGTGFVGVQGVERECM